MKDLKDYLHLLIVNNTEYYFIDSGSFVLDFNEIRVDESQIIGTLFLKILSNLDYIIKLMDVFMKDINGTRKITTHPELLDNFINDIKKIDNIFAFLIKKELTYHSTLLTHQRLSTIKSYISILKEYIDLYFLKNNQKPFSLLYFEHLGIYKIVIPKNERHFLIQKDNIFIPAEKLFLTLCEDDKSQNETIQDIYNITNKYTNIYSNSEIFPSTLYFIDSYKEFFSIFLGYFIDNNLTIKKCKNCGKYFIPESRTDEKYCNHVSPQNPNKTCKEYGVKKTYRDNIKSRPLKDEHYKTSQFFRMRIKRNKDKNNIEEVEKLEKQFTKYKLDYEKKQRQYNNKKLTEEDFKNWIIQQKER